MISVLVVGMFLVLAFTVTAILIPRMWLLIALCVCGFLPISVGSLGRIDSLRVIELLAIPVLPVVLVPALSSARPLVQRGAGILWAGVAVLSAVAILNVIRTAGMVVFPVRAYYDLATGVALFVEIAWLAAEVRNKGEDFRLLLKVLLGAGLVAGVLRAGAYFGGVSLPLLGGTFDYGVSHAWKGGAVVNRIGGLAEASRIVLAASAGLLVAGGNRVWIWAAGSIGLVLVLLSGGRALAVGVLAAACLPAIVLLPRQRARGVLMVVFVGCTAWVLAYATGILTQLTRISSLSLSVAKDDPFRARAMSVMWTEFLANPLVGKGVGTVHAGLDPFTEQQVTLGGHGAYMSILGNFGIVGFAALLCMTVAVVIVSARYFSALTRDLWPRPDLAGSVLFVLVLSVILCVQLVAESNGYSDPIVYAVAGLLAGLLGQRSRTPAESPRRLGMSDGPPDLGRHV